MPNKHICAVVSSSTSLKDDVYNNYSNTCHNTELDSHTNMVVVCKHAVVVAHTGKTVEVKPFSPDCKSMDEVPIVDAVIKWY